MPTPPTRRTPRPPRRPSAAERRASMPPRLRILIDVGGAVLAAAVTAYIAHYPAAFSWPITALFAGGAAVVFLAWRAVPRFVATAAVLATWTFLVPAVTWLVAAVTPNFGLDYQSRMAALALYGLLIAVLAHRTTSGRPWITVAAALAATTVVAFIAYQLHWAAGVWLGYAAGLVVVALRGGLWDWIRDTADQIAEWWQTRRHPPTADLARWHDPRSAQLATAATLSSLPEDYRVLHDRTIPGSKDDAATIDHLALGPGGVFVIASLHLTGGAIQQGRDGTLWNQQRSLDRDLREIWWQTRVVTTRTQLPAAAVLAVHGAHIPRPLRVGLFDHHGPNGETLTGTVTLVAADDATHQLAELIAAPTPIGWSGPQIRRYTRRTARAFPAGRLAHPSRWHERLAITQLWPYTAQPLAVDDDGHLPTAGEVQPEPAQQPAAVHAASSAAALPPSTGRDEPVPAAPPAVAALDLPEHREYQWDGGPDVDQLADAAVDELANYHYAPGDRVNVLRPDGMLIGWVVLSDAYIHADGPQPCVDIADPNDWAEAERTGTTPRFIAEPAERLMST